MKVTEKEKKTFDESHVASWKWMLFKTPMQSSGLDIEGSKEKFHFPQAPNTVKIGFCPACFAKRFFQPKLSVRPVPMSAAREPGHSSNLHYLGRRVLLLALLYYCTVRFMSLSACICYINKHSSTLSYISQLTLIESSSELLLLWAPLLSMIWMFVLEPVDVNVHLRKCVYLRKGAAEP